jgi:hypothetical protein
VTLPEWLPLAVTLAVSLLALLGTLGGVWLGDHLAVRRAANDRLAQLRAQYVSEFLGVAYTNLRYLWSRDDNKAHPNGGTPADFSVLGNRAGLLYLLPSRRVATWCKAQELTAQDGRLSRSFAINARAAAREEQRREAESEYATRLHDSHHDDDALRAFTRIRAREEMAALLQRVKLSPRQDRLLTAYLELGSPTAALQQLRERKSLWTSLMQKLSRAA